MEPIRYINKENIQYKHNIEISIYVTYKCNQSCDYCIVKNNITQKSKNKDIFNIKIFDIFEQLNTPGITLRLMGGEPTFIENFEDLYLKINDMIQRNKLAGLKIMTNGSFNIDRFNNLPYNKNIEFIISMHPDFMTFKRLKNIDKKLKHNKQFYILLKYNGHKEVDAAIDYFINNKLDNFSLVPLVGQNIPEKYKEIVNKLDDTDSDNITQMVKLGNLNRCYTIFQLNGNKIQSICRNTIFDVSNKNIERYLKNGILCSKKYCSACSGKICYVEVLK